VESFYHLVEHPGTYAERAAIAAAAAAAAAVALVAVALVAAVPSAAVPVLVELAVAGSVLTSAPYSVAPIPRSDSEDSLRPSQRILTAPSREVCRPAAIPVTCSARFFSDLVALFLVLSFPLLVSCGPPRLLLPANSSWNPGDLGLAIVMAAQAKRRMRPPSLRVASQVVEVAFQQAEVGRGDDCSSSRTSRKPTAAYAVTPEVNILTSSV
jgi:hypothetical protein